MIQPYFPVSFISFFMQLSCALKGMKQNSKQFCLQLFSQVARKHKAHFFCTEFLQDIQREDSKKAKHVDSPIISENQPLHW